MKHIFLNLKQFDIPKDKGEVNSIAPIHQRGSYINIVINICRLFLSIMRTLPTLVLALIATLIFNLGIFAGTVAIAIFNYRFDINMKNASVLGLVGAGGIGAPLIFNMNSYRWNAVGSLLIGLVIMVFIIEYISTRIRIKLTRGL